MIAAAGVEYSNEGAREYILDWSIEGDDYLSWFEKSQLEYDGDIGIKEPVIEYSELVEKV